MSAVVHARVTEQLTRLRLRYVAERLDAVLNDAARTEPTYLDFLDSVLRQEVDAKQRTRVTMALKIAHFPSLKTLEDFDFKFQPSVDQRLVRELATGRFIAQGENVLLFGAPVSARRISRLRSAGRSSKPATRCSSPAPRPCLRVGQGRNRRPTRRLAALLQQDEAADHRLMPRPQ